MSRIATPRCPRVPERCYVKSPVGDELMSQAAAGITSLVLAAGGTELGLAIPPPPALPCSASQAGSSRPPSQPTPPGLRQRQHRWRKRGAGLCPSTVSGNIPAEGCVSPEAPVSLGGLPDSRFCRVTRDLGPWAHGLVWSASWPWQLLATPSSGRPAMPGLGSLPSPPPCNPLRGLPNRAGSFSPAGLGWIRPL